MARKLVVNKSEWAFILAWTQVMDLLEDLEAYPFKEIFPIKLGDIHRDSWIYIGDDPYYTKGCGRQYRKITRTASMESKSRVPSIKVTASLIGIETEYDVPRSNTANEWWVESVTINIGTHSSYTFRYEDADRLEPGCSWTPSKEALGLLHSG